MDPYVVTLGAVLALMIGVWVISLAVRDASIVDPVWALAFVAIAWTMFVQVGGPGDAPDRAVIIVVLVTIWGTRLAGYLTWRKAGTPEDYRYVRMRERFGSSFWLASLPVVFLLQAGLAWIVSLPVQAGQIGAVPLGLLDSAGVGLFLVGLAFETIGDLQLARFKADPANAGQVMDRGLWRYTRHPNYFGDFCVWWGLYLIAAAAGAWWTVVGAVLMSILLLRVSGVALLEGTIAQRRPGYEAYARRTSAFFPRPPRRTP